jgi:hypothetical protein
MTPTAQVAAWGGAFCFLLFVLIGHGTRRWINGVVGAIVWPVVLIVVSRAVGRSEQRGADEE